MALWQFDVALNAKDAALSTVTDEGYDLALLSELAMVRANKFLVQHFGQPWEMLPQWSTFGTENGNRFDVVAGEGGGGTITARIDARSSAHFLPCVCELAVLIGCVLYVPEQKTCIQPNRAELEKALSESRASRFVRDPHSVLKGES